MTARIKKGGTRGTLFRDLAKMRLLDAEVLLKGKRYEGAVYLAGYAVECALKWAVTEREETIYLDGALETHDLDILLKASGLDHYMSEDSKIRPLFSALSDGWGPQGRYSGQRIAAKEASLLYNQARQVYTWVIEKSL
jgi:HEPN domain-containing protein